jgi:hypothetical protein
LEVVDMGGGSGEDPKQAEAVAAQQQPMAQALQMSQYPAFMPGQQNALADQMHQFYGAPVDEYRTMLGQNTQSAERPTLRNPTDIETYLNNLANPGGGGAGSAAGGMGNQAQAAKTAGAYLAGDSGAQYPTQPSEYGYGKNFFGR